MEDRQCAESILKVRRIDIPAGLLFRCSIPEMDPDFPSVLQPEQFLVIRIDETDSSLCLMQVLIQPVTAVAITVHTVFSTVRIQA